MKKLLTLLTITLLAASCTSSTPEEQTQTQDTTEICIPMDSTLVDTLVTDTF